MKNMRKLGVLLAFMLIFTSVFAGPISADGNTDKNMVKITVLGTSDLHGAVNSWSYESNKDYGNVGLVKIYSIVKAVREENPNTLVVDNGDNLQGSILTDDLYNTDLSKPNPMIDMMNLIGYDAMTLGNHEFNFGLDLIKKAEKEANFPILSANIYNKADESHFVKPYIIKEVEGVKVGILGLTVPSIPRWDGPRVTSLMFKHMGEEAKVYAKELKEEGADVIVAVVHSGLETRHEEDGSDAARFVAEYAPEIDIMLTGHDHSQVNETINGVLVGAPAAKYGQATEVARFDLELEKDGDTWKVANKEASHISISDYDALPEAVERAKPYHETTLDFLKDTIGVATDDFHPAPEVPGIPEAQIRDTAVIDIVNEVQLKYTGADVAAAALFKSGSNLPKGDINFANIFDIYKYANKLVGVEVTGAQLKEYMEWSASYFNTYKPGDVTISFNPEIRGYNYDMFAGVEYKIDISKPAGERIVDLTMKGEPVEDDQIIKLAINDYRYSGLLNMGIIDGEAYFNSDPVTLRSYIKDYIQEQGTISPKVDNNWNITGVDLNHPLRNIIIQMVKDGEIELPTSKDGRTPNVKALNVYELIEEGVLEGYNTLTIAHTNDMHGFFVEGKYDGMGVAKITTIVNELEEANKNFLLLDGGDATQGNNLVTLSKGKNAIEVMNAMSYDAMAAGNHEFDYSKERLTELANMAKFPMLAANIFNQDIYTVQKGDVLWKIAKKYGLSWKEVAEYNALKNPNLIFPNQKLKVMGDDASSFLTKYIIKEMDGIKVGIFGLSTPETIYMSHPKNTEGLTFKDPVETAKEMVKELEGKVDVIVALSHLGLEGDQTSENVAKNVEGIDVIIDGHSHTELAEGKVVNGTLIAQAGEKTKDLGIIQLAFKDGVVIEKRATLFTKSEAANVDKDSTINDIIEKVKAENEKIEAEVVANSPVVLDGERANVRTGETNLGNLITEAMLDVSNADVALANGGGIRASIDEGEVTKGEVLTVLPFGNAVQVIKVTGADIKAAMENGISDYPEAKGAFPHIAGMTVTFDPSKEAGNRVVEIKVAGEALDMEKEYTLVTSDFLAAGGDGYDMFDGKPVVGEYNALDEVLIQFIQENGFDKAKTDERIKPVDEVSSIVVELPLVA